MSTTNRQTNGQTSTTSGKTSTTIGEISTKSEQMSTTSGQASTMGDQTSFESTTSDKTVSTTIVTLINVFFLKKISENHYL